MSETFILQIIWSIMLFILGFAAIYFIGMKAAARKLLERSQQLQQKMMNFQAKPNKMVSESLGSMGIEGILNELGVDVGILNNPMVKGLVAKYAPRVIEQMSKKGSENKEVTYGL